jgi:hypothetical protein
VSSGDPLSQPLVFVAMRMPPGTSFPCVATSGPQPPPPEIVLLTVDPACIGTKSHELASAPPSAPPISRALAWSRASQPLRPPRPDLQRPRTGFLLRISTRSTSLAPVWELQGARIPLPCCLPFLPRTAPRLADATTAQAARADSWRTRWMGEPPQPPSYVRPSYRRARGAIYCCPLQLQLLLPAPVGVWVALPRLPYSPA